MKFDELKQALPAPIFSILDVKKLFPREKAESLRIDLHRFIHSGKIEVLKRGIYILPNTQIDEFVIANYLYQPSYVSLASVLNNYGVIPDIPMNVTSVTPITPNTFTTPYGTFLYSRLKRSLYYGYESHQDPQSGLYYHIAVPEKALLDYIYLRRARGSFEEERISLQYLHLPKLRRLSRAFPLWVQHIVQRETQEMKKALAHVPPR